MQQIAAIPAYLHETYWWAYVHPSAVRLFERQWLVNLILWGNFAKLRDAALAQLKSAADKEGDGLLAELARDSLASGGIGVARSKR